jgi:hypothetical protein
VRQAEHHVDVEGVAALFQIDDGLTRHLGRVAAVGELVHVRRERLDADAEPVEAQAHEPLDPFGIAEVIGVSLDVQLAVGGHREARANVVEDAPEVAVGEHDRRPAADVERLDASLRHPGHVVDVVR